MPFAKSTASLVLGLTLAGWAWAQPDTPPADPAGKSTAATEAPSDTDYANTAAIADMYEVKAAAIAESRSSRDEVKELAKMIATDHTASSTEMLAIVRAMDGSLPTELDERHEAMIKALEDADAAAFDQAYLDQQVAAHQEALALHQSYAEGGANADLKALAAKVVPKIQMHLDHATELGGKAGSQGAPSR